MGYMWLRKNLQEGIKDFRKLGYAGRRRTGGGREWEVFFEINCVFID
jgi:hypothetical protein